MKRLSDARVQEYDVSNPDNIGGTLDKKFIRIDSDFIVKYFDEITKSNCNYVSYADDLIRECYDPKQRDSNGKKVLPIKYFSVLVKDPNGHDSAYNGGFLEVLMSRFANLMGVKTVYNMSVKYKGRECIMSLDFLKDGETMTTLDDLATIYLNADINNINGDYYELTPLNTWCSLIIKVLNNALKLPEKDKKPIINRFMCDFCTQMLFRNLIAGDQDLYPYNIGVVFSKDRKNAFLAPAHDYEYCDTATYSLLSFFEASSDYFEYMHKHCPKTLDKFMNRLKKVFFDEYDDFRHDRLDAFLYQFKPEYMSDNALDYYYNNLYNNISRLSFAYDAFMETPGFPLDIGQIAKDYLEEQHMKCN